ncbi:MAG: hypothetical protein CVT99_07475 [Bacteroidetes bacterium HGW-Bacteroidetes-16]|jgi:hypothetical protein|nr:MAG: hypothetical protein CVT99_07475 [Bacteroidetes bacterium HGW-Bacteroidetes-16]
MSISGGVKTDFQLCSGFIFLDRTHNLQIITSIPSITWIKIQAYNIGRAYPDTNRDFVMGAIDCYNQHKNQRLPRL